MGFDRYNNTIFVLISNYILQTVEHFSRECYNYQSLRVVSPYNDMK